MVVMVGDSCAEGSLDDEVEAAAGENNGQAGKSCSRPASDLARQQHQRQQQQHQHPAAAAAAATTSAAGATNADTEAGNGDEEDGLALALGAGVSGGDSTPKQKKVELMSLGGRINATHRKISKAAGTAPRMVSDAVRDDLLDAIDEFLSKVCGLWCKCRDLLKTMVVYTTCRGQSMLRKCVVICLT